MAIQARHILSAMVFWGQIQNYMMRVNLSILIVAMVKDVKKSQNVTSNVEFSCETSGNWTLNSEQMGPAVVKLQNDEGFGPWSAARMDHKVFYNINSIKIV